MKTKQYIQKFILILVLCFSMSAVKSQVSYGRISQGNNTSIEINNTWNDDNNVSFLNTQDSDQVEIKIYPNPTRGRLNVEGVKDGTISIYKLNGQVVFQTRIENETTKLNLGNLAAGLYSMQIKSSKGRFTKKIVLQ